MNRSEYDQGVRLIQELVGENAKNWISMLDNVNPDLSRYTIEFAYGMILSRPGLDLKSREIATIAALISLGTASTQLEAHIDAALEIGLTTTEIIELIIQMAVYAGFPAALNGMMVANTVFKRRMERCQK